MSNKITQIDKKIKRLEIEKKALKRNTDKFQKRKLRTRRLIQVGALTEKYFSLEENSIEEVEEILSQFSSYVKSKKINKHKKE